MPSAPGRSPVHGTVALPVAARRALLAGLVPLAGLTQLASLMLLAGLVLLTACGSGGAPGVAGSMAPPTAPVTAPASPIPSLTQTAPGGAVLPPTVLPPTAPPATAPPAGVPSTPPRSPAPTGPPILRPGASGPEVDQLQRHLVAAGYWLGTPDGSFGLLTQQAVLAVQKTAGIGLDGVVGPATRQAIAAGVRPTAQSTAGLVLEVDIAKQLLLVVRDGQVETVFNTSTGTDEIYVHDGVQHLADTPRGTWHVYRQVDGVDSGPLGDLYRPKYFHTDGIAFHGYASVPAVAASHGCVRVTNAAMDWLWSSGVAEIGTTVLVY